LLQSNITTNTEDQQHLNGPSPWRGIYHSLVYMFSIIQVL